MVNNKEDRAFRKPRLSRRLKKLYQSQIDRDVHISRFIARRNIRIINNNGFSGFTQLRIAFEMRNKYRGR